MLKKQQQRREKARQIKGHNIQDLFSSYKNLMTDRHLPGLPVNSNYDSNPFEFSFSQESYIATQSSERKVNQKHSASTDNLAVSPREDFHLMATYKTILVTDAVSKVSLALTFTGNPISRGKTANYTTDAGVTFAVLDLTQETCHECPASIFYQALIYLFASEPKFFLVNDPDRYRKPVLYTEDESKSVVGFKELKHRGQYKLKFVKNNTQDGLILGNDDSDADVEMWNQEAHQNIENAIHKYLKVTPAEVFLRFEL